MILSIRRQPPTVVFNDPKTMTFYAELEFEGVPNAPGACEALLLCMCVEYEDGEHVANQTLVACKNHLFTSQPAHQSCSLAAFLAAEPGVPTGHGASQGDGRLRLRVEEVSSLKVHRDRCFRLRYFVTRRDGSVVSTAVSTTAFRVLSKDPAKRKRGEVFQAQQAMRRAVCAAKKAARCATKAARCATKAARCATKAANAAAAAAAAAATPAPAPAPRKKARTEEARTEEPPPARPCPCPCHFPCHFRRPLYHFTPSDLRDFGDGIPMLPSFAAFEWSREV